MKRKILSLLLVFVLLCGMLPAALAVEDDTSGTQQPGQTEGDNTGDGSGEDKDPGTPPDTSNPDGDKHEHKFSEWKTVKEATCKEKGSQERNCTVEGCSKRETREISVTDEHTVTPNTYKETSSTKHTYTCSVCSKDIEESHDLNSSGVCTKCGYSGGEHKHKYDQSGYCSGCKEFNTAAVKSVSISPSKLTISVDKSEDLTCIARDANDEYTKPSKITWESNDTRYVSVSSSGRVTGNREGSARITVTADGKTDYIDVYVEDSYDADISVTIYDGDEEYVFGDSPSVKGKSVYDQLSSQLTSSKIGYRERDFDDLDFSLSTSSTSVGTVSPKKGSVDEFDEVSFSVKKTGTFTCDYTIKDGNKTVLSGIIEIIVKEGKGSSKGDISYTGTRGGTVYFDARDFEDYFEDEYPRGELEYVTFSRASNGTVYYDGKKISTSDEFYANPGKRDKDLDEVYYEPSSDTYTGTATVSFTAYGENSSGTSKSTSGVVSIVYSSANAKDISYQATNGSVRLNTDDFVSTYKKATGVTSSNPTMYIRFTKLPSKGNLYVGYTANGGGSKVSTSTYYSSKSSASSYIGDITYVPSAAGGTETVEYTAYSTDASSGLKYTGKIVFTANAAVSNRPVNIYYNCTGGSVKFASADFSGSSESMALIDYLTFGTPSNGALYTNYANGSGDKVSAGNLFAYYSLPSMGYQRIDAVTYVPPMGWSGTASVPFTAYLVGGGTITGTVSISVTATSSTSLRDVKTTDWYATYVTDLMAAGVLTGYEDNTFRSTNNVTYGEILKLVMLSTGYSEQSKTGTHWASGYVERALSDGIISERVNPDAYADRAAVADIAAKAMKLAPVTGGTSPFTDSANGYARALYNAGIITGYEENGRTYYRGANRIERSHIAAIIWRIMNYDGKTVTPPTNPSQPTTPSRPDTEVPDWLRS